MKLIDSSFPVGGGTVLVKATDSGFLSKINKASTEDSDLCVCGGGGECCAAVCQKDWRLFTIPRKSTSRQRAEAIN